MLLLLCCLASLGCQRWWWERADTAGADAAAGSAYLAEGHAARDAGRLDTAMASFILALEENPRLVEAHLGMADIYRDRGQHQFAADAYERATKADPNHYDAHFNLGRMKHLLGRLTEAVRVYLRALAINPKSFEANYYLSLVYLQLDRPSDALPHARAAVELDAESQPAAQQLGFVYLRLGRPANAVEIFRSAVELGEPSEQLLLGLTDAHIRLGNYARAGNVLDTMLRKSPSAVAHERKGYVLFKLRKFDEAIVAYRAALALDSEHTAALNGVGACLMTRYLREGSRDRALLRDAMNVWKQSLRLRPDQPRIIDLIAKYDEP